jgi:hypothetical protein
MKKLLTAGILGVASMAFAMNVTVAPVVKFTSIGNGDTKTQSGGEIILSQNIKGNFGIDGEIAITSGKIAGITDNYDTNMYQVALLPTYIFNFGNVGLKLKVGAEYTTMFLKFNVTGYDDYYKLYGISPKGAVELKYKHFLFGISYTKSKLKLEGEDKHDFSQGAVYLGYSF